MLYQQGDILIQRIETLPSNLEVIAPENGRYILARGEASGHAHAINDNILLFREEGKDVLYCLADDYFTLRHEEHENIEIPPGMYQVRKVRQFEYFQIDRNVISVND
ncbi:MAG: hypothetical protein ACOY3O_00325 [Thermodesulfobacteriota bacterium]